MECHGLEAASTWHVQGGGKSFTFRGWRRNSRPITLDYFMVSRCFRSRAGVLNSERALTSDHYPVWCSLVCNHRLAVPVVNRRKRTGWQPTSPDQHALYASGVQRHGCYLAWQFCFCYLAVRPGVYDVCLC
eukprot:11219717-Lingulodinium_polyedra.AAC.1